MKTRTNTAAAAGAALLFLALTSCGTASDVAELGVYEDTKTGLAMDRDASSLLPDRPAPSEAPKMKPPPAEEPAPECHRFTAHAPESSDPYSVPANQVQYVRFTFDAPWRGEQFIRSVKPLTDQYRAVHNWLLYAEPRALAAGVETSNEPKRTGALLYGWIPGSSALELPSEFAIPAPGDVSYTLEVRYYNVNGPAVLDASGVEVCLAAQPPFFTVSLQQREEL